MADVPLKSTGSELWALLPTSPDAYLQKIDLVRNLMLLVRLDANAYRSASFLDDRILGPATQGVWLPITRVVEGARAVVARAPVHFIFHTGHVGSTLVSRLLEDAAPVLSLREPLPLRTLADAHDVLHQPESLLDPARFAELLELSLRLWARGYADTRAVVVKATSSAGRVAIPVLEAGSASRAIYLNVRAEPYLATLLAGQNSPDDLRGHGPGRMRRLQGRTPVALTPLHALSIGELAALGWLVETGSQQDAVRRFPDRVRLLDFDAFLKDVAGETRAVLGHLDLPQDEPYLAGVGSSAVLQRYSKAPDRAFTPEDRAALLRESRQRNREEIARGLAWLERLGREDTAVAAILETAR